MTVRSPFARQGQQNRAGKNKKNKKNKWQTLVPGLHSSLFIHSSDVTWVLASGRPPPGRQWKKKKGEKRLAEGMQALVQVHGCASHFISRLLDCQYVYHIPRDVQGDVTVDRDERTLI